MCKYKNEILERPRGLSSGVFILWSSSQTCSETQKRGPPASRRVQGNILPFRTSFVNDTIYKFTCYCTSEEKVLAGGKPPFVFLKPHYKHTARSQFGFGPLVMIVLLSATAFSPSYRPPGCPLESLPDDSSLNPELSERQEQPQLLGPEFLRPQPPPQHTLLVGPLVGLGSLGASAAHPVSWCQLRGHTDVSCLWMGRGGNGSQHLTGTQASFQTVHAWEPLRVPADCPPPHILHRD